MEYPLLGIAIGLFLGVNVGIITMAMFNAALRDEPSESAAEHRRTDRAGSSESREPSLADLGVGRAGRAVVGLTAPTHGTSTLRTKKSA